MVNARRTPLLFLVLRAPSLSELSPRTFCTFPREFSLFRQQGANGQPP